MSTPVVSQETLKNLLIKAGFSGKLPKIELLWVTPKKMRKLNQKHRGFDAPTDVLSFPLYSYEEVEHAKTGKGEMPLLGSLVLCKEEIETEAKTQNRTFEDQFLWSLGHGIKHLCGYDHSDDGKEWLPIHTKKLPF